jgi:hypothetical protein
MGTQTAQDPNSQSGAQEPIYVCLYCYQVCENPTSCHESPMLVCNPGRPGSPRRKPVVDRSGRLLSRAPRWFLEATGWIESQAPYTLWREL